MFFDLKNKKSLILLSLLIIFNNVLCDVEWCLEGGQEKCSSEISPECCYFENDIVGKCVGQGVCRLVAGAHKSESDYSGSSSSGGDSDSLHEDDIDWSKGDRKIQKIAQKAPNWCYAATSTMLRNFYLSETKKQCDYVNENVQNAKATGRGDRLIVDQDFDCDCCTFKKESNDRINCESKHITQCKMQEGQIFNYVAGGLGKLPLCKSYDVGISSEEELYARLKDGPVIMGQGAHWTVIYGWKKEGGSSHFLQWDPDPFNFRGIEKTPSWSDISGNSFVYDCKAPTREDFDKNDREIRVEQNTRKFGEMWHSYVWNKKCRPFDYFTYNYEKAFLSYTVTDGQTDVEALQNTRETQKSNLATKVTPTEVKDRITRELAGGKDPNELFDSLKTDFDTIDCKTYMIDIWKRCIDSLSSIRDDENAKKFCCRKKRGHVFTSRDAGDCTVGGFHYDRDTKRKNDEWERKLQQNRQKIQRRVVEILKRKVEKKRKERIVSSKAKDGTGLQERLKRMKAKSKNSSHHLKALDLQSSSKKAVKSKSTRTTRKSQIKKQ